MLIGLFIVSQSISMFIVESKPLDQEKRATDRAASRNPRSSAPACAPRIENFLQKWITAKPYAQSPPALGFAARTRTENSEHFFTVLQFLMWPHGVEGKHKRMIYRRKAYFS